MKINLWYASALLLVTLPTERAIPATAVANPVPRESSLTWTARARSEHQTEWFSVAYTTNAGTGRVRATTNSYVAIATGLNRRDPATGQWIESKEEIELVAGGAIARKGQHQVSFAANINTVGAIDLTTPDGQHLRSHVIGLAYTDTATGKSALIAEIKDAVGEVSGNQVFYRDAFSGPFIADMRYSYTRGGFEQDVIIRETPPSPTEYGMAPETTRMEVWSEFVEAPVPQKTTTLLKPEAAALKPQPSSRSP